MSGYYTLVNRDCLEGMKELEDGAVDFAFTDPPYNVGKDYGIYKDDLPYEEYLFWLSEVIVEMKRVSSGKICLLLGHKKLKSIWDLVPEADLVIAHKRAIGGFDNYYLYMYCPVLVTAKPVKRSRDLWNDIRFPSEGYYFTEPRFQHPAHTSMAFTRKVIKTYTNRGDVVLDPFVGVGTTAVACKELGRSCIGFEINNDFLSIGNSRLESTYEGKVLGGVFV